MEKKKILLSVNQKLYSVIKKNAEANDWSINREIVEMLYTALEARTNYIKKVNARREALTDVTQQNNNNNFSNEQEISDYLNSFDEDEKTELTDEFIRKTLKSLDEKDDPDAPKLRTEKDIKEYLNKLSEN